MPPGRVFSIFSAPSPELWNLNRKNYIGKGESIETKTNFSLQHLLEKLRKWHFEIWYCSFHPLLPTLQFLPMEFLKCSQQICPHRFGADPFSFFTIHSSSKENTGAAQLSCSRIDTFGHLSHKAAAFPACSCPCARSKPSISLPTASMACQIHALPLPNDALLLFHLSTHPPVWLQCHQHQPGLKTDKLSSYFSCLPLP